LCHTASSYPVLNSSLANPLAKNPQPAKKRLLLLRRSSGKTFSVGSFLKSENSTSERPGARGHYEEPLSHRPCRGCARHRRHAGGDEQGLQEQPTWVVRSDVYPTAPHKDRVRLTPVINLVRPSLKLVVIDFDQTPERGALVRVVLSGALGFSPYASFFVRLLFLYDYGAHRRRGVADRLIKHLNVRKRASLSPSCNRSDSYGGVTTALTGRERSIVSKG